MKKFFFVLLPLILTELFLLGEFSPSKAQEGYYSYVGLCENHYQSYDKCIMCRKNSPDSDVHAKACWKCVSDFIGCVKCPQINVGYSSLAEYRKKHSANLCWDCASKDVCYKCGTYLGSGDVATAASRDKRKVVERYTVTIQLPGKKEEFMKYWNSGAESFQKQKYEEALNYFKKCDEIIPDGTAYMSGMCLYGLERYDEAIKLFDIAIRDEPDYGGTYGGKGLALARLQRLDEAEPLLKKAIDLKLNDPLVFAAYGLILENKNHAEKAIPYYTAAVEYNPKAYKLYLNIGNTNYDLQKWNEAENAFKAYLQYEKDNFYALSMIGEIYNKKQKYDEALTYLLKGYEINPAHKELNYQIGISYENLKQFDKAEEHFKKALSIDPNLTYILKELGEMYFTQSKFEDALNSFLQCDNKAPNDVRVIFMLGHCYGYLNQLDKAESNFKRALSINPELTDVQLALADVYRFQNKLIEAIPVYQKLISSKAVNYTVYFDLSVCQFYSKQYQDAIESSKKYLAEDKTNNPQPYLIIAISEVRLKHFKEALLACNKALELNVSGLSEVYYNVACAYSLMNEKEKALENLEKALMTGKVNISNLESDEDFANVRQTEVYKKLLAKYK